MIRTCPPVTASSEDLWVAINQSLQRLFSLVTLLQYPNQPQVTLCACTCSNNNQEKTDKFYLSFCTCSVWTTLQLCSGKTCTFERLNTFNFVLSVQFSAMIKQLGLSGLNCMLPRKQGAQEGSCHHDRQIQKCLLFFGGGLKVKISIKQLQKRKYKETKVFT